MNRTAKCSHNERHAAILEQLVLPAATWVCLKNTYICKLAKLIYRGKKKNQKLGRWRQKLARRGIHAGVMVMLYVLIGAGIQSAVMTCAFHGTSVLPQRKKRNHKQILDSGCCCCYYCSVAQSYLFATPWNAARQASLSLTIS